MHVFRFISQMIMFFVVPVSCFADTYILANQPLVQSITLPNADRLEFVGSTSIVGSSGGQILLGTFTLIQGYPFQTICSNGTCFPASPYVSAGVSFTLPDFLTLRDISNQGRLTTTNALLSIEGRLADDGVGNRFLSFDPQFIELTPSVQLLVNGGQVFQPNLQPASTLGLTGQLLILPTVGSGSGAPPTSIPEPSAFVLLTTGLLALSGGARRQLAVRSTTVPVVSVRGRFMQPSCSVE